MGLAIALAGCGPAGGGGGERPGEGGAPQEAGSYVVLVDSSRIHFVFTRDGAPATGSFPRVLGALVLTESPRGWLNGTGRLSVDLASVTLDDSTQARALSETLFETGRGGEFRIAELRVRELFGKRFKAGIPVGAVTPVSVQGQLRVHRMALSRRFDGEIARTPGGGWRLTTALPLVLSFSELGLDEELAAWRGATGVQSVSDGVALSVDLRLARRGD